MAKGRKPIQGLQGQANKPAPASKLSNKLLDMKFMQKAESKDKREEREVQQKKVEDESMWSLIDDENRNRRRKPEIKKVGYSDLLTSTTMPISGRKSFGAKPEPEPESESESTTSKDQTNDNSKSSKPPKTKKRKSDINNTYDKLKKLKS